MSKRGNDKNVIFSFTPGEQVVMMIFQSVRHRHIQKKNTVIIFCGQKNTISYHEIRIILLCDIF